MALGHGSRESVSGDQEVTSAARSNEVSNAEMPVKEGVYTSLNFRIDIPVAFL